MKTLKLGEWSHAFDGVMPGLERVALQALRETGETIMAASKRMVPYRTGALQGSGTVFPPRRDGRRFIIVLGYGGPAVPYALYVHENLTARHMPGTGAKYLEIPVLELAPKLLPENIKRLAAAATWSPPTR